MNVMTKQSNKLSAKKNGLI